MFTSVNNPQVRWIIKKGDSSNNATNLPIVINTLLSGGNPTAYMTLNGEYAVTLGVGSSTPNSGSSFCFQHNNIGNSTEPNDIPTLGVAGTYIWIDGMFWGNIDLVSNYGGFMNSKTAWIGAAGGNTGDRLLVYVR
jgi:hypothetical protein